MKIISDSTYLSASITESVMEYTSDSTYLSATITESALKNTYNFMYLSLYRISIHHIITSRLLLPSSPFTPKFIYQHASVSVIYPFLSIISSQQFFFFSPSRIGIKLMALFTLFILSCLTSISSFSTASSSELATEVCRKTTNFALCRAALYSDPRAPTADRYDLAYIAFGQAYKNATDTKNYIDSWIKSNKRGQGSEIFKGMKICQGYYNKAIWEISEVLNNLDSESYYGLDESAVVVGNCGRGCKASLRRGSPVAMPEKNRNLILLSNICYVVSKLF